MDKRHNYSKCYDCEVEGLRVSFPIRVMNESGAYDERVLCADCLSKRMGVWELARFMKIKGA